MNRRLLSGWIMIGLSLGARAETVTNNFDMQSNLVINVGYVPAGDSGFSFTNEAIRGIAVSVGQLSGVDPETGNLITNTANLLPLKAQSLDVAGLITGDGSGLTNLQVEGRVSQVESQISGIGDQLSVTSNQVFDVESQISNLESQTNSWNSAVSDLGLLTSDLQTHYLKNSDDTLTGNLTVEGNLEAGTVRANTYRLPQTFVGAYNSLDRGELTAPAFAGWSDVFQGSTFDTVEYWDDAWMTWTTDANGVTAANFARLFDGDETVGIKPELSRYKWRVTFTIPGFSTWYRRRIFGRRAQQHDRQSWPTQADGQAILRPALGTWVDQCLSTRCNQPIPMGFFSKLAFARQSRQCWPGQTSFQFLSGWSGPPLTHTAIYHFLFFWKKYKIIGKIRGPKFDKVKR